MNSTPARIVRTDYWRLTVHFFPKGTVAGRRPVQHHEFDTEWKPEWNRPNAIDFESPPSRADFLAVVAATPWMQGWKADLLPLIEMNQWPMVQPGYKSESVDLKDADGNIVGRLEVERERRFSNSGYCIPMLGYADLHSFLNRRIRDKAKRELARDHVAANRNLILERLMQSEDHSPMAILDEVERVLRDGGFLRKSGAAKHRQRQVEAVQC